MTLEGTTRITTTDSNGLYEFIALTPGTHALSFSLTGWSFPPNQVLATVESGGTTTQDVSASLTQFEVVETVSGAPQYNYQVVNAVGQNSAMVMLGGENGVFVYYDTNSESWSDNSWTGVISSTICPTDETITWVGLTTTSGGIGLIDEGGPVEYLPRGHLR